MSELTQCTVGWAAVGCPSPRPQALRSSDEATFQLMTFSRCLACLAGSFLLSLSGWTADSPDAALGMTNITFRNHVQPVLAKFGCSSGACHGAAAGQNGFKLSLRGYDDEGDYLALTRQALGRRIIPSDPAAVCSCLNRPPRSRTKAASASRSAHGNTASWPNGSPPERRDRS